jgi:flagellar basal-body rod modification protein FlgD
MSSNPVSTVTSAAAQPSAAAAAAQAASSVPSNMQISESGFLRLISAQMQSQNPLQPADPTQFLTQLEGMSEVSSMQNVQSSINALTSSMQSSQVLSGTSLLGHFVLAPGASARLSAGGTVSGAVSAPAGASALTVAITDASGALVKSLSVAPQSSGLTYYTWDGTTSSGAVAPPGQYQISVSAAVGGASQALSPLVASQVASVTLDPSSNTLQLNTSNGTIPLSSIVSVM